MLLFNSLQLRFHILSFLNVFLSHYSNSDIEINSTKDAELLLLSAWNVAALRRLWPDTCTWSKRWPTSPRWVMCIASARRVAATCWAVPPPKAGALASFLTRGGRNVGHQEWMGGIRPSPPWAWDSVEEETKPGVIRQESAVINTSKWAWKEILQKIIRADLDGSWGWEGGGGREVIEKSCTYPDYLWIYEYFTF